MQATAPESRHKGLLYVEIAVRVAAGDGDAFHPIMLRHNQALYRAVCGILRDDAEADDAVQEGYLFAYRAMGRFRGDALGDTAQRAWRSTRSLGPHVLTVLTFTRMISAVALVIMASPTPASDGALSGDPVAGEAIYGRCLACHALAYDRTGARHCGLFGRRAGSVKDSDWSAAMKHSNIVWSEKILDRFLANPLQSIPGTSMGYAGVTIKKERTDLIA